MKRRSVVVAGVAAAGAVAGVGTALWRLSARPASDDAADLWSLSFERPAAAEPVRMAALRGRPLLLNFWATWCAPCVIEMPMLDAFATEHASAGWKVLALAVDRAEPVRAFAAERRLTLPLALAGAGGVDLSRRLGNTVGALPFSVVFASSGDAFDRRLGAVDAALLAHWRERVN